MPKLRPPVKTHGGKYYLAPWIIDNFPAGYEDMIYGEPFVGGGSVLLQKKKSHAEHISDTDWNIICVWNALQRASAPFLSRLSSLPYSSETFEAGRLFLEEGTKSEPFDIAVSEYVVRRMSRGGMRKAFAWSDRLRGGKPGDLNAWETALKSLPAISARIADVAVHCDDFRHTLHWMSWPNHLLYLDPPYLKSTRAKGATEVYENEMSDKDHQDMLDLCNDSNAKIVISGYDSSLYSQALSSWNKVYKDVPNHASQKSSKDTKREVLWKNF